MAKKSKPQQENTPGPNTLPATVSIRPAEPFWDDLLEIANVLGISLGEIAKLASEATVRMVKGDVIRVPEYVDKARTLYAAGFGPKREERAFVGGKASGTRDAEADDFRDDLLTTLGIFDHIPCGSPQPSWAQRAIGEVKVRKGLYPEDAFCLIAQGDSLNRAKLHNGKKGIQDGDVLVCQCIERRPANEGDIGVFMVNGDFTCKRLTKDGLSPESTNRKNKAIAIPEGGVRAVAVVIDAIKVPIKKYIS